MRLTRIAIVVLVVCGAAQRAEASAITFSATGAVAAGIQTTVDSFRTALGILNPNVAGSFDSGRREINWDGVPDALAAPNNLPANFFNVNSPRGVVFSTPGTGFQVSATAASGIPVEFGNLDPTYSALFATFSAQRLFTALGSPVTDVNFFVPGTSTPACTSGFGAVFSDVDLAGVSSIQYFDLGGSSLGTFFVPNIGGNETLSFLGVLFNAGECIGRVRITSGSGADAVVMDDFIYGEPGTVPAAVPEPATGVLTMIGVAALMATRVRRRHGR